MIVAREGVVAPARADAVGGIIAGESVAVGRAHEVFDGGVEVDRDLARGGDALAPSRANIAPVPRREGQRDGHGLVAGIQGVHAHTVPHEVRLVLTQAVGVVPRPYRFGGAVQVLQGSEVEITKACAVHLMPINPRIRVGVRHHREFGIVFDARHTDLREVEGVRQA